MISAAVFAVMVWGSLLLVLATFGYLVAAMVGVGLGDTPPEVGR